MLQQGKIQNPQSGLMSQAKGPQFGDRDIVNDQLSSLKHLTENYNVFAREASHRTLHNDVLSILTETHTQTRDLFNIMFRKGWYQLEPEQPQKLQQTHQQFVNNQTQFPYNPGVMQ